MSQKKTFFAAIVMAIFVFSAMTIGVDESWAEWQTTIVVEGDSIPGYYYYQNLAIGEQENQQLISAPPPPPEYIMYARLFEVNNPQESYFYMYYDQSIKNYGWLLEIDPNGNIMPPISRSVEIRWDPATLPTNRIFMVSNYYSGQIYVEDMHNQSLFTISGTEVQYLLIQMRFLPVENTNVHRFYCKYPCGRDRRALKIE